MVKKIIQPNATITGQSGPVCNGNEGVLHISQRSRAENTPSDAVLCHI